MRTYVLLIYIFSGIFNEILDAFDKKMMDLAALGTSKLKISSLTPKANFHFS